MDHPEGIGRQIQVLVYCCLGPYKHHKSLNGRRGKDHGTFPPPEFLPGLSSMTDHYNHRRDHLDVSIDLKNVSGLAFVSLLQWRGGKNSEWDLDSTWGKMSRCKHGKCIHDPLLLRLFWFFESASFGRCRHIVLVSRSWALLSGCLLRTPPVKKIWKIKTYEDWFQAPSICITYRLQRNKVVLARTSR